MEDNTGVSVAQVMREIEEQLWDRCVWKQVPRIPTEISDDLYAPPLQRLRELAANLYVEFEVSADKTLLVGRAVGWLRKHLHNLVLYYVNNLAHRIATLTFIILQVLDHLAAENKQLREETKRLREEVQRYRYHVVRERRVGQYRLRDKELRRRISRRW